MDSVVIVSAARTPLGGFNGKLKPLTAVDLGSVVIKRVVEDFNVKIDSVYMGCVLSAGLGQSAARQAAIKSGLDKAVNCVNINKICGSGMAALMFAKNAILAGENEVVVAGGMESMTNAPYLLENARSGYRFGDDKIVDHMVRDGLLDAYEKCVMGTYAEDTAASYGLTREMQDEFAINSFTKARKSTEAGYAKNEIVPLNVKDRKAEYTVDTDEIPFSVDLSRVPILKPSFKEGGTVTAASASSISDGAAAMLIMKESKAKALGLNPLARIVAQSSYSQSPKLFTTAPIGAIKQVLEKSNWDLKDVDLFEINEAFAVVAMAAIKELSIDESKVNVLGGACALGHPLGASGARIIVTLLNAMRLNNAKKGLATLCVGGGEGVAMTFERV
ncbi:MAG: thiolase family protein [Alphaproteobacteria bacterium]|nr:thiolase family protein [Alphaproteobacteria bacterium]